MGALLMGPDGGFITGSDILMDGGVTAAYGLETSRKSAPRRRRAPQRRGQPGYRFVTRFSSYAVSGRASAA